MKMQEITVDVGVKMNVDESTANACLKIVEMYLNQNENKRLAKWMYDDGNICLELVDEDDYDEDYDVPDWDEYDDYEDDEDDDDDDEEKARAYECFYIRKRR